MTWWGSDVIEDKHFRAAMRVFCKLRAFTSQVSVETTKANNCHFHTFMFNLSTPRPNRQQEKLLNQSRRSITYHWRFAPRRWKKSRHQIIHVRQQHVRRMHNEFAQGCQCWRLKTGLLDTQRLYQQRKQLKRKETETWNRFKSITCGERPGFWKRLE